MNKQERELAYLELRGEREILDTMREHYKVALKRVNAEIDRLSERTDLSGIRQKRYQEELAEQIGGIIDDLGSGCYASLEDYLSRCYEESFIGTLYNLQRQGIPLAFPLDQESMARSVTRTADDIKLSTRVYDNVGKMQSQVAAEITRGFADGSHVSEIADRIATETDIAAEIKKRVAGRTDQALRRAMTIARTEKGRVRAESRLAAMHRAKDEGADIVKQWDSTMDSRTREDHRKLNGQIRELDEDFEIRGVRGPAPHKMGRPEHDINCRCVCLQRARAALEMEEGLDYTKWDGVNQCQVDLSDAESYQEFKTRYDALLDGKSNVQPEGDALRKVNGSPYTEEELSGAMRTKTTDTISENFNSIVNDAWGDRNVAIMGVDPLKDKMIDFVDAQIRDTWGSTWGMMPHLIEEIGEPEAVKIFNALNGRNYEGYMKFAVDRGWLTQADVDYVCVLDKYSGTTNYKAINSWLRGDYDAIYGPVEEEWISAIDRVIDNQVLDKPLEVTRYYRDFPDELKAEFAKGGTFSDKAYMSTTLADDHLFLENSTAVVHISVPPGKGRGVYIDGIEEVIPSHHWDAEAGKVDGEKEFLIKRDAEFDVVRYEEVDGRVEIWLEMKDGAEATSKAAGSGTTSASSGGSKTRKTTADDENAEREEKEKEERRNDSVREAREKKVEPGPFVPPEGFKDSEELLVYLDNLGRESYEDDDIGTITAKMLAEDDGLRSDVLDELENDPHMSRKRRREIEAVVSRAQEYKELESSKEAAVVDHGREIVCSPKGYTDRVYEAVNKSDAVSLPWEEHIRYREAAKASDADEELINTFYVRNPDESWAINSYLRGLDEYTDDDHRATVDALIRAANNSPLQQDIVVTRYASDAEDGISSFINKTLKLDPERFLDLTSDEAQALLVDQKIPDAAFVSTSTNTNNVFKERSVAMVITAKKGTPAYFTDNESESELIFPPNTPAVITGVEVLDYRGDDLLKRDRTTKLILYVTMG